MVDKKAVMAIADNFMHETSAHGFKRVIHSRTPNRRCIWIAVMISALGFLTYNCYTVINEYYAYRTALVVQMKDPNEMAFPAVTICVLQRQSLFVDSDRSSRESLSRQRRKAQVSFNQAIETQGKFPNVFGKTKRYVPKRRFVENKLQQRSVFSAEHPKISNKNKLGWHRKHKPIMESNKLPDMYISFKHTRRKEIMKNFNTIKEVRFLDERSKALRNISKFILARTQTDITESTEDFHNCNDNHGFQNNSFIFRPDVDLRNVKTTNTRFRRNVAKTNSKMKSKSQDEECKSIVGGLDLCNIEKYVKYNRTAKDTILVCSFDLKTCTHQDFNHFESEDYGKCYTFNGNSSTITGKFGASSGLHLVMKVVNYSANTRTSGIRTIVHSTKEKPFPEDDGINVPPSMLADIAVTKSIIKRATPPHGQCTMDTGIYHWNDMFGDFPYSRQGCIKVCHCQLVLDRCDCTLNIRIGKSLRGNVDHCRKDPKKEDCSEVVISQAECNHCFPACEEEAFDTSVSYSQLVSSSDHEYCGNSICNSVDIMAIHVYYKDLSYEIKIETPMYTMSALISNLGGTLGLCLGLSLVTIVEVIELLVDLGYLCLFGSSSTSKITKASRFGRNINVHPTRQIVPSRPIFIREINVSSALANQTQRLY